MERSYYNNDITIKNLNEEVSLVGWIAKKRNFGSLVFIDLRDRSGIVQLVFGSDIDTHDLKSEYVISIKGKVQKREKANPELNSGEIEIAVTSLEVLSKAKVTPMLIQDDTDALEDTRLKYRYLDLRRPKMQEYLRKRAKIVRAAHEYFDNNGFIEVETPCLILSTPEGARDYIVPSRVQNGSFYALPQSPQLFKQLLMIGGFERYYQIARCFRDEDLRQDRQPEFTQIDLEMSFLDQEQILTIMEGFLKKIFKEVVNYDVPLPLRRLDYKEAIDKYGSDKPDTRFDLFLHNVESIFKDSEFKVYKESPSVKALVIPAVASETSRKKIDELTMEIKKYGVGGLGVLKYLEGNLEGSFAKFLSEKEKAELIETLSLKDNDLILFAAGKYERTSVGLGALRSRYAVELGLIKPNTYDLLWVVNFPLFEKNDDGTYSALHHPFTRVTPETAHFLKEDPSKALSAAYDIVINGYEAGGGSLRIYDEDMQKQVFNILGFSDEDIKNKFGYFVDAFQYGTPPHGGIAFGLERLSMILGGTDNIRDVIAFPKNLRAACPMSGAPTKVDEKQLEELGIKLIKE